MGICECVFERGDPYTEEMHAGCKGPIFIYACLHVILVEREGK